MGIQLTSTQNATIGKALRNRMREIRERGSNPALANERSIARINHMYTSMPDGADAMTGFSVLDSRDSAYAHSLQVIDSANVIDVPFEVLDATDVQNKYDLRDAQRFIPVSERAQATKQSVDAKVPTYPVGDSGFGSVVERIFRGRAPETAETRRAKQRAAQSSRTDIPPDVTKVLYAKDSCTSQGQPINYKVTMQKVDWGRAIKENSRSTAESIEHLISYLTNAIRDSYGGWGRITEIIVRDQQLIINRSCFRPVIDPRTIEAGTFPIDTLDYLREGAIAGFFDWSMLKHMRNLRVLDVDDLGFYETNIGGRLKCGRRIGVATLFNLCSSLEVLILGGDSVSRDELSSEKSVHLKKRLADHKRFSLFSDGFKIEICKNTNAFAGWTAGNMKAYACNRGNKGLFGYSIGVLARAGLAGGALVLNIGTHLVGGIRDAFKEAMTPVNPEDVGLK